jgi:hypothetical protein
MAEPGPVALDLNGPDVPARILGSSCVLEPFCHRCGFFAAPRPRMLEFSVPGFASYVLGRSTTAEF